MRLDAEDGVRCDTSSHTPLADFCSGIFHSAPSCTIIDHRLSTMASSALQPRLAFALSSPLLGCSAPKVVGLESRRWIHLRAAQRARPTRTGGLGTRTIAPGCASSGLPSRRRFECSPSRNASPAHLAAPGASLAVLPFLPSLSDLSSTLLAHPLSSPLTGLPSYGFTIVLLTLLVRAGTTLPATIWARRRAIRFRTEVKPRMRGANERMAVEVMKECRKAGVGYEGYKNELRKRVRVDGLTGGEWG